MDGWMDGWMDEWINVDQWWMIQEVKNLGVPVPFYQLQIRHGVARNWTWALTMIGCQLYTCNHMASVLTATSCFPQPKFNAFFVSYGGRSVQSRNKGIPGGIKRIGEFGLSSLYRWHTRTNWLSFFKVIRHFIFKLLLHSKKFLKPHAKNGFDCTECLAFTMSMTT